MTCVALHPEICARGNELLKPGMYGVDRRRFIQSAARDANLGIGVLHALIHYAEVVATASELVFI